MEPEGRTSSPADLILIMTRVAFGALGLLSAAVAEALEQLANPMRGGARMPARLAAGAVRTSSLAFVAATLESERRTVALWSAARRLGTPFLSALARQPLIRPSLALINRRVEGWVERGDREQLENERLVREWFSEALPDLIAVVLDHVDFDAVVTRVDLDAVLSRVDLDAVVSRVDLDEIVARVDVGEVVRRIDLDDVVGRIDLDALAARIDVNSIIERVDLPRFTQQVIDEVDLREVVRESTSTITTESVDALRYQGMNLDRGLSRAMDRLLFRDRRRGREIQGEIEEGMEQPSEVGSLDGSGG